MKARSESASKSKRNGSSQVSVSGPASDGLPREQMIAEAAYFRAERRGFTPGSEMSDWLEAEADVEGLRRSGS